MNWVDAVGAGADVVVAISAAFAAWFAATGLNAWRVELKGRRAYELAEEVMLGMYEAKEVFRWMRSSASFSSEYDDLKRDEGESDEDFRLRAYYSLAALRYSKHVALFGRLRSATSRVRLHFGEGHAAPIQSLLKAVDEVIYRGEHAIVLSKRLAEVERMAKMSTRSSLAKVADRITMQLNDADAKYSSTDDELTKQVDSAIADAERLFKPTLS